MQYIWILKYILYCNFTKRNLASAYYEGGAFGCLLGFPLLSYYMFFGGFSMGIGYAIAFFVFMFNLIITWNYDNEMAKYHYFDLNKWKMKRKFTVVRWFIFFDILTFFLSLIYGVG